LRNLKQKYGVFAGGKANFDIKERSKCNRQGKEMTCAVDKEVDLTHDTKNTLVGGCVIPLGGNNETIH
jgi:hypothetical protein